MKLLSRDKDGLAFYLPKREKSLLLTVLNRYPLVPARYQQLTKAATASGGDPNEALLEESLAEHRRSNRERLNAWVRTGTHWQPAGEGWQLRLDHSEIEWLLQLLNDIRVGSWILLGSPAKDLWNLALNQSTAPLAWTMETAGWFEAGLLEALSTGGTAGSGN